MDQITEKYNQVAQAQFQHIETVAAAFRQKCEQLKVDIEKEIAALDSTKPDTINQTNLLKLKFKRELDTVVDQFEKEMKKSFGNSLVNLEEIYRQKELLRLLEIEKEVLTY